MIICRTLSVSKISSVKCRCSKSENTGSGVYTVKPVINWQREGGAYVLSLIDNGVRFDGINSDIMPDGEDKNHYAFRLQGRNEQRKALKDGIVTIPKSRIREDDDKEHIYLSRSEFEALSIHEGTVIFADDAEEPKRSERCVV